MATRVGRPEEIKDALDTLVIPDLVQIILHFDKFFLDESQRVWIEVNQLCTFSVRGDRTEIRKREDRNPWCPRVCWFPHLDDGDYILD